MKLHIVECVGGGPQFYVDAERFDKADDDETFGSNGLADWLHIPKGDLRIIKYSIEGTTTQRGEALQSPVPAPFPAIPAWDGQGLPPVGTVCDYLFNAWEKAKVVAHVREGERTHAVVQLTKDWDYSDNLEKFRPIRTPEQIEAEERAAVLRDLVSLIEGADAAHKTFAEAIYDAGYRKCPST